MPVPRIFISHSHRDRAQAHRLLMHLRALERQGIAEIFYDVDLPPGAAWKPEIEKAIHDSKIAVLLISPSFLASDYIVEQELPLLLRRHRDEGIAVLPVALEPSLWSAVPDLAELQFANDPSKPLSGLSEYEQDSAYAGISRRIAELAFAFADRDASHGAKAARKASVTPGRQRKHIFISHSGEDGDFAELLKLKLQAEGHEAWVDADRLEPGLDWRAEIDEALRKAAAVVAIMSPEARASEYVTYEWAFAWGCGTRVLPIMLKPTSLHPRLAALQYLDFTNRNARPWRRLLDALLDHRGHQEGNTVAGEG